MAHGEFCRRRTGNFDACLCFGNAPTPIPSAAVQGTPDHAHVGWKFDFSIPMLRMRARAGPRPMRRVCVGASEGGAYELLR